MKQECEIVRDLMPLVLDDVASDGASTWCRRMCRRARNVPHT